MYNNIKEQLEFIEYRQYLLFYNTPLCRVLFKYNITKNQYGSIAKLLDRYNEDAMNGVPVNISTFTQEVYSIAPQNRGNIEFLHTLLREFYNEGAHQMIIASLYPSIVGEHHTLANTLYED